MFGNYCLKSVFQCLKKRKYFLISLPNRHLDFWDKLLNDNVNLNSLADSLLYIECTEFLLISMHFFIT